MSHNLFSLFHSDLFYSTVEIIWHAFGVCWVNFFHVVTTHRTHSSDVLFIHVFVQINVFSMHNINPTYSVLTIVVMTVDCRVGHSFQSLQLLHRHLFRINKYSW